MRNETVKGNDMHKLYVYCSCNKHKWYWSGVSVGEDKGFRIAHKTAEMEGGRQGGSEMVRGSEVCIA